MEYVKLKDNNILEGYMFPPVPGADQPKDLSEDGGDDYVVNFLYNDISSADYEGDNNDASEAEDDMSYGDIGEYDGDNCDDDGDNDSDSDGEQKIVTLSENDSLALCNDNYKGDNKSNVNQITEIRGRNTMEITRSNIKENTGNPNGTKSNFNNFLKQQEQELLQMQRMLKIKQAYIDKLKK